MKEMEVHDSEWKHMVSQWSVCARQKKEKAWMGSNFYQKIETLLKVLYCLHIVWHSSVRR